MSTVFTKWVVLQHTYTVINKANCQEISCGRSEILFSQGLSQSLYAYGKFMTVP